MTWQEALRRCANRLERIIRWMGINGWRAISTFVPWATHSWKRTLTVLLVVELIIFAFRPSADGKVIYLEVALVFVVLILRALLLGGKKAKS